MEESNLDVDRQMRGGGREEGRETVHNAEKDM